MDLLVLGGTVFVGRHFVEAALARGHRVTIFHRGTKGTGLIPGVEEILGDRDGQIDRIGERRWDAVVDTCGYVPRVVRQSVEATVGKADRYLFVSTVSVYENDGDGGLRLPILKEPVGTEEVTGETYGPLKIECEQAVQEAFGDRALIVRPGIVAGPYDPTNRFTYWVERLAQGGEVLVPNVAHSPVQAIDARDLGNFMVLALEKGMGGSFDAAGEPMTFAGLIEELHALNLGSVLVWADEAVLAAQDVHLWQDLPLALPTGDDSHATMRVTSSAALAQGLQRRPLLQTAQETLDWAKSRERPERERFGLTREREIAVIEAVKGH